MKFALVLPTWVRTPERAQLAGACFESLLATNYTGETPLLLLLIRSGIYEYPLDRLRQRFWVLPRDQRHDGAEFVGTDQPMVYGTDRAFESGADFVVQLGDDTLFHPDWLWYLQMLIRRHPEAAAWSPYRSARLDVHKTLAYVGEDVQVRSINGNGLTFSRAEWQQMGLDWRKGVWESYYLGLPTNTLDLYHVTTRPGERWVTRRSYIEHTGLHGDHARPQDGEVALDFVGVK